MGGYPGKSWWGVPPGSPIPPFNDDTFSFLIPYVSNTSIDIAEIPFSREKVPQKCLKEKPIRKNAVILPVSLSFYMALSRGSCRKQWKARSTPLVPHVIELCSTSRELIGCPMLKSMI